MSYMNNKNLLKQANTAFDKVRIRIASKEDILSWSHGEVTKAETINYKTLKPEVGGLFDEAIFGPVKDYECACGKYKKVKHYGKVCEKCGVEITESIVRRERMGHIALTSPIVHIWMSKELPNPSKISLLLNISYKEVNQVIYFVNYIVLNPGKKEFNDGILKYKEIVDLASKSQMKSSRQKLRKLLQSITKSIEDKESIDYMRSVHYFNYLKNSSMPFSIEEVFNFITKYTGIKFGIGAEAIQYLLKEIDLEKGLEDIKEELTTTDTNSSQAKRLLRRLACFKWFKESANKPEWMVMNYIPVTPPETRPIIQLDGGRFTTSDINSFYHKIIIRNERLKKMIQCHAPAIIVNNEKRMLQDAVDALFDNSSRKKPSLGKDRRPLKSLSDHLKGKQGLFRQNLLGKRVDYSGRSVIVIGPELKMYEVGIPAIILLKLFKPFIIRELIRNTDEFGKEIKPIATNIRNAEKLILKQDDKIWPILERVIKDRPVLLNRAPTLHRLGIQAFEPKITNGKAIQLHPLVTTAFNADFDGDQMAVHLPLTDEAVAEARSIMLASKHILGPKDGKPIVTPTQDMILGNYYLTIEKKNLKGEGSIFATADEAANAYYLKKVDLQALIGIPTSAYKEKTFPRQGLILTTVGKIIFNSALPKDMNYLNKIGSFITFDENLIIPYNENFREAISKHELLKPFDKKCLSEIIDILYYQYPLNEVAKILDQIKAIGFKYSTKSSTTVSIFDVPSYDKKQQYFDEADKKVQMLQEYYLDGALTDDERYSKVIRLWTDVKDKVSDDIKKLISEPKYQDNSIVRMANSGARGNISNFTQLSGMRGLMSKSYNYDQKTENKVIRDTIEIPIKHSFIEGLTVSEYFNSSYGARKGMADIAMKTSKSGYMTRKLVDAAQEIVIHTIDCGTKEGLIVSKIVDKKEGTLIEDLFDRISDRFAAKDIINPKTNEVIVAAGEIISNKQAKQIIDAGIEEVEIRSVLACKLEHGICQKCFGNDLTTKHPIEVGEAIGVIAAQSIGEPGTQLTMRTFHTGGVAGGSNITQGFERLKQLLDVIPPKPWEKALISEIEGQVTKIETTTTGIEVTIKGVTDEVVYDRTFASNGGPLRVTKGQHISFGDKVFDGVIDIRELLKVAGIEKVREYILKEVQKVYRLQGIEISDRYIEIIIRQLTNKVQIQNPGDSSYFIGQVTTINEFYNVCKVLYKKNQTLPTAINLVFSIDDVPSKTDSFLSAASFQGTKKILTDAAVKAQIDPLLGLKENVILGNLIPAGTGLKTREQILQAGKKAYNEEY